MSLYRPTLLPSAPMLNNYQLWVLHTQNIQH